MDIRNVKDKERGYLLGLFVGDGYMNYNKKDRHYRVEFHLNSLRDREIANKLCGILKKLGLNHFIFKDKRFNSVRIRVNSKPMMNFIEKSVSALYSKKLSTNYKLGFLSGFIDAEGYVNNGEILLTQKEKKTLQLVKNICHSMNIQVRKFWVEDNYKSRNKIWRLRICTEFKYLKHNSYKIERMYPKRSRA